MSPLPHGSFYCIANRFFSQKPKNQFKSGYYGPILDFLKQELTIKM